MRPSVSASTSSATAHHSTNSRRNNRYRLRGRDGSVIVSFAGSVQLSVTSPSSTCTRPTRQ
ncbi:hypothetical protein PIB19_19350 [Sphingomonas sp. 7/4-4]|uniref:hypothetical protein n=1 Tax=Sphingomonas sp. 7/4-4 TaxID=3018446 RepID=UPI0022F3F25D|nr:hypothetical protein [Sphingomonas sp. 7/4-4]WBY07474.1 hypothetical protein PIB19_19350 [Sphingomonas sp. 7/4-4]